MRDLTIVIPVLDDGPALRRLLCDLRAVTGAEIVVVDGGSSDDSAAIARAAGATTLTSARGRARQLRAGCERASRRWLWLLHADSHISAEVVAALDGVMAEGRPAWGRFDVQLTGRDALLRGVEAMMNLRSRLTGVCTGDQGIFVHRELLDAIGGVPDQPLMEDVELSKRLKRLARPRCPRARIETSSRRWETQGAVRTILLMWSLRLAYFSGVSAARLARIYYGR